MYLNIYTVSKWENIYIYTQIECNKTKQNKKSASCVHMHTHIHTK